MNLACFREESDHVGMAAGLYHVYQTGLGQARRGCVSGHGAMAMAITVVMAAVTITVAMGHGPGQGQLPHTVQRTTWSHGHMTVMAHGQGKVRPLAQISTYQCIHWISSLLRMV